ncbi:phosphatidylinositol diacylglycerol-lyase activity protein [[Candida] boidinii]|nr:phosphatidylinositol diacylglycerol-lyase activity protein [[Candida] boidinii]OWB60793.1 phosphatidylinositol diacylglycerol-lyase activity protein [[Candida] boidinii]OWB72822.1 phosphatidylinositol diacylglycerol-lyase activity protein [[Candida] boidinii]
MVDYSNWLKEINDDIEISKLSIPGTHNSAACHMALPSVRCQNESVTDQLKNGVRFLDVRLSKNFLTTSLDDTDKVNDIIVCHGKFPVKLIGSVKFNDLLEEVYDFLESHNSETVILSIKQEGNLEWDNSNDEFPKCINDRYINKRKDKWYLNNTIPKLRDCKGKIILFRRFGVNDNNLKNNLGITANGWSYNTTDQDCGLFRVQDFCELENVDDIKKKANYVKDMINNATNYNETNSDPKLFVNFCSGANFFNTECWPENVADVMEDNGVYDEFKKGCGIVVVDYCDKDNWKSVRNLVDKNF